MINEVEAFVYRIRLPSLFKIEPQLPHDVLETPPLRTPFRSTSASEKSSLREALTLGLRSILSDAYIAVE